MSRAKRVVLSAAPILAMASPALADPISTALGSLIFSGLYTIGVPGAIANFIAVNGLGIIATGISIAASLAARPGSVKPSDAKSNYSTEESPIREGIGRVRSAGLRFFGNTDGSTRWRVIGHFRGPVDAIETYYLGGQDVVVDGSGWVQSAPWLKRDGTSYARIETKLGASGHPAWPALVTAFPDKWTSDHRLRGIFNNLVTFYNPGLDSRQYLKLYQSGTPELEVVARASLVYSVLDETCDPSDASTWIWSDNSVDCVAHVMRRDPRLFNPDLWDWTLMALTAVKCNENVSTRLGPEKRSRLWGIWSYEDKRSDTVQKMLDSAGLAIRMTAAGKIYLELIEDAPTAEIAFTDRDILEDTWQAGPEAVERPNICRVRYYCAPREYSMSEINLDGIAWAIDEEEVSRYGEKYYDVQLDYCPSAAQAQRIARRKFALERADTYGAKMQMAGMAAWGMLYGTVKTEYDDAPRLINFDPVQYDDSDGSVSISGKYWPVLPAWNTATDEADPPEEIPAMNYVADVPTPAAPTSAEDVDLGSGSRQLRVNYVVVDEEDVEASYRVYTGGVPGAWIAMTAGADFATAPGDLRGKTIDARVRIYEDGDGWSDWSDYLNTTIS